VRKAWNLPEELYLVCANPEKGTVETFIEASGFGLAALADLSLRDRISLSIDGVISLRDRTPTGDRLIDSALDSVTNSFSARRQSTIDASEVTAVLAYESVREALVAAQVVNQVARTNWLGFTRQRFPIASVVAQSEVRLRFSRAIEGRVVVASRTAALAAIFTGSYNPPFGYDKSFVEAARRVAEADPLGRALIRVVANIKAANEARANEDSGFAGAS
jgi:hypothetical protein